jgi:hypothetical protein
VLLLRGLAVGGVPAMQLEGESGVFVGLSSTGWAYLDLLLPADAGPWAAPHVEWPGWIGLVLAGLMVRWSPLGAAWIAICWMPMAGWLPLEVRESRALLYLPAAGLSLVCAGLVQQRQRWKSGVGGLVLLGLFGMQYRALSHWSDPLALWTWGVETNPAHPLPQVNLGRVYAEAGQPERARVHYTNAAALAEARHDATFFVRAAHALGELALLEGDTEAARVYFMDAVSVAGVGTHPDSERRLGELAARNEETQESRPPE